MVRLDEGVRMRVVENDCAPPEITVMTSNEVEFARCVGLVRTGAQHWAV